MEKKEGKITKRKPRIKKSLDMENYKTRKYYPIFDKLKETNNYKIIEKLTSIQILDYLKYSEQYDLLTIKRFHHIADHNTQSSIIKLDSLDELEKLLEIHESTFGHNLYIGLTVKQEVRSRIYHHRFNHRIPAQCVVAYCEDVDDVRAVEKRLTERFKPIYDKSKSEKETIERGKLYSFFYDLHTLSNYF